MPTNLALDDKLISEAVRLGRHKTKKEAVNAALAEYIKSRQRRRVLDLFGQVDFDPTFDHKAHRRSRR